MECVRHPPSNRCWRFLPGLIGLDRCGQRLDRKQVVATGCLPSILSGQHAARDQAMQMHVLALAKGSLPIAYPLTAFDGRNDIDFVTVRDWLVELLFPDQLVVVKDQNDRVKPAFLGPDQAAQNGVAGCGGLQAGPDVIARNGDFAATVYPFG